MNAIDSAVRKEVERIGGLVPLWGNDFTRLSSRDIRALESKAGFSFSEEYKSFLRQFGCSCFDKDVRYTPKVRLPSSYTANGQALFGIFLGKESAKYGDANTIQWQIERFEGILPRNFVPIAPDDTNSMIFLGLDKAGKERVYFWYAEDDFDPDEYEGREVPKKVLWKPLTLIADSFLDFLSRLQEKGKKKR